MKKINFNWFYYWLGCIIGGIILGGTIVYFFNSPVLPGPPLSSPLPSFAPSPRVTPDKPVTLLFVGDVMLGRSVNQHIYESNDPSWPYIYVKDVLRSADITYINLESPLVSNCPVVESGMKFCGATSNVQGLVDAGIDVASLANNHATNYGSAGLSETVKLLSDSGIAPIGVGTSSSIVREGYLYTFLSFNDVGEDASAKLTTIPKRAKELVIVTFHWGSEYQSQPNNRQIMLAHKAIDLGADLVIGAHPHWVQTKEIYKDKPIYYSLGNFVFDQEWSLKTKQGLAVRFTYRGTELLKTEELPVLIENYGQPRLDIN